MKRVVRGLLVILVVAAGAALLVAMPTLPDRGAVVPTARVTRGPVEPTVHAVGDLRAGRTVTLVAPSGSGLLRIVRLVATGQSVKAGDSVIEFDPADQVFALEQARSEVAEAEQEIVKLEADAAVQAAQDRVDLLTARFDVRRGELDVSGNEFIGAIDAQKNLLSLEEAKRRLAQLEEDVKSRAATNDASLAVAREKRTKATLAMQRAQQNIDGLILRAPIDGVVSLKENRDAMGGIMFFGMALPELREGDTLWPGRPVADVIESGRMEVRAKVDENDRANLAQGQPATVQIDTLPGLSFKARVGALAALANRGNFFESASITRQFDVTFQFDEVDPRMKAGASARVTIEGRAIADALTVPRQAVFQKNGRTQVFVRTGSGFDPREVKVTQRTESRALIEGLAEGTEIALVDPDAARAAGQPAVAGPLPAGGGPR